jgi:hypothetical protein
MNRIRSLLTPVVVLLSLLVIGLIANQHVQAAPAGELTRASATFAHFFLFRATSSPTPWWQTYTRVDASGGVHTAFYTNQEVYYAHCAMACDNPANWTETPIADAGYYDSLNYPVVDVDSAGRPRMMWYHDPDYVYAECNANCANAANWTAIQVPVSAPSGYIYPQTARYFALDAQGRPRFVCYGWDYDDENVYEGFQYTTCDGNCTTASNWHSSLIDLNTYIEQPQIVLSTNGQPRVMGLNTDNELTYLGCNTNCSQAENWGRTTLYPIGYWGNFSFRLDSLGQPRVAFYTQDSSDGALYYAWSNSTAIASTVWFSDSLALPPNDERTVDLAIDSQNHPRMAFASNQENLDYVECTANCESTSSTWQLQHIETGDELDLSDPIPPGGGCLTSVWMLLGYPSLALDAADQPNVSYYARHSKLCLGGDGQYHILNDVWALRFANVSGSSTPTAPGSVIPTGPALGIIDVSYTFTATVSPITTTQPITYVWQATGLTTQTHTGRGASDTATFTWPSGATGVKTISVSASNQVGTAHGSKNIIISETPIVFNHWVYLPLVIRH